MRTIDDIQKEMTARYIQDSAVVEKYGLDPGKTYEEQFSKICLSSILFYCVAAAIWIHEQLMATFRSDIDQQIAELKPHSLRWYRNKTLAFRYGQNLMEETDRYDDTHLSEDAVAKMQVVKYVAVSEAKDASTLFIKVAGESSDGLRQPISDNQLTALASYLQEVKDAGVYIALINRQADQMMIDLVVYYDPMVLLNDGQAIDGSGEPVRAAVEGYIRNLPFNGEYRNVELVDILQKVRGVKIPELNAARSKFGQHDYEFIQARCRPDAGYFAFENNSDLTIKYLPYEDVF